MRLTEFANTTVDESVKDWLGRAALGAALTMTPSASAAPAPSPDQAERVLMDIARTSGLKGAELAAFMSQCAHETLNFTHLKEIGGSLDFRKYDPGFKQGRQKAKVLGNVKAGDGARYKGRGFIQLTGRDNYHRAGEALGLPLEDKPELVEKPSIAARVAVWFWQNQVKPEVENFNDVRQVTKKINPGLHGLESRKSLFQDYKDKIAQLFNKKPENKTEPKPEQAKITPPQGSYVFHTDTKTWDEPEKVSVKPSKPKLTPFDTLAKKK